MREPDQLGDEEERDQIFKRTRYLYMVIEVEQRVPALRSTW